MNREEGRTKRRENVLRLRNRNGEQYQSQVSVLGPVGYGPTTLPLRHSD
ncbi:hypothetical protein V6Z11_D01G086300 [Gossypium hirsutum]